MQTQKDEVKNNIIVAASDEFLTHGYGSSSMRTIASNAGITVGNIYSYFKSKEDLFETIVLPTVLQIKGLILMKFSSNNIITPSAAMGLTNQIVDACLHDRRTFLILMTSAKGSKYENIKSVIQTQLKDRLIVDLLPRLHIGMGNEILADTLSLVLLEGIVHIVQQTREEEELMKKLICDFLLLVFGNITQRL